MRVTCTPPWTWVGPWNWLLWWLWATHSPSITSLPLSLHRCMHCLTLHFSFVVGKTFPFWSSVSLVDPLSPMDLLLWLIFLSLSFGMDSTHNSIQGGKVRIVIVGVMSWGKWGIVHLLLPSSLVLLFFLVSTCTKLLFYPHFSLNFLGHHRDCGTLRPWRSFSCLLVPSTLWSCISYTNVMEVVSYS